ncbi:hypothetical protein HPB49_009751 [Dermacentor silvarum]|uniref:Uncharacterized protein n=1 Tax=Dermacentor silvarum TaxID=543639 RepID=A0ACB8DYW6_DERSI|nr:hypothetical protein HPB49_009751 [Dermacentor silvarum]
MRCELELRTQHPGQSLLEYVRAMQEFFLLADPVASDAEKVERAIRQAHPAFGAYPRSPLYRDLNDRTRTPERAVLPRTANANGKSVPLRTRGNPIAVPLWLVNENHLELETRPGPLHRTEPLSATIGMNAAILPEHALHCVLPVAGASLPVGKRRQYEGMVVKGNIWLQWQREVRRPSAAPLARAPHSAAKIGTLAGTAENRFLTSIALLRWSRFRLPRRPRR